MSTRVDLGQRELCLNSVGDVPAEGQSIFRSTKPDYRIEQSTGCWEWLKGKTHTGYPQRYAHRRYFEAANPKVNLTGLDVHHRCHNRACVNPEHLEAIDHPEHLRHHKRAKSPLTVEQVREIRSSLEPMAHTARRLGVTYDTVRDIKRGKNWRNVDAEIPARPCDWCGAPITEGAWSRRYCSDAHRQAAQRARRAAA